MTKWYEDPENVIKDLEVAEHGITKLMGHYAGDGEWEYAVVYWRHRSCTVVALFKNGKLIE